MHQEYTNTQVIELTKEIESGVKFDSDAVTLLGIYKDELSLFRAKRNWSEILEANFLLEPTYDYSFHKITQPDSASFILKCSFLTACGRYAFWRLTNDQAPEAQYLIETAHIPNSDMAADLFITAPDLSPLKKPTEEGLLRSAEQSLLATDKVLNQLKGMIEKFTKSLLKK